MSMRKALAQEPTGTMYEEQERQKMLRLAREMREPQAQEPRLEWIYSGDKAQSEEYLLGKKLDGDASAGTAAEDLTTSTVDLANKIREDPLYLIKKQELEQQKKLLENPVRLKQIKEYLEQREQSSRSSSHKKKRHHSRSRSRSPARQHHRGHRRSPSPRRRRSPSPRRRRSPSPRRDRSQRDQRRRTPPRRQEKISREERERRIEQMLKDGAARTEQRRENVRKFKEHDEKEEKVNELIREKARKMNELSSSDEDETDFIRPMMKQVIDDPYLKRRDLKHHHLSKKS